MINLKKAWDQARIKLMTPGSAIRLATYCAMGRCTYFDMEFGMLYLNAEMQN